MSHMQFGGMLDRLDDIPDIFEATGRANVDVVVESLRNGVDVNVECKGWRPLHWAVYCLLEEIAKKKKVNGNERKKYEGYVAQRWAVLEGVLGREDLDLDALIRRDSHRHFMGATPLMIAAAREDVDVVTVLLDRGANVDTEDHRGLTVLKRSCDNARRNDYRLFDLLLRRGPAA